MEIEATEGISVENVTRSTVLPVKPEVQVTGKCFMNYDRFAQLVLQINPSGKGIFGDILKVIDKMGENLKLMRFS